MFIDVIVRLNNISFHLQSVCIQEALFRGKRNHNIEVELICIRSRLMDKKAGALTLVLIPFYIYMLCNLLTTKDLCPSLTLVLHPNQ